VHEAPTLQAAKPADDAGVATSYLACYMCCASKTRRLTCAQQRDSGDTTTTTTTKLAPDSTTPSWPCADKTFLTPGH
jgi:hypothetical protein